MSRRVAAVDCGTNSIRLLIADIDPERRVLTDIAREMRIVRLGEGVDKTGRLSQAALGRTIGALREYAELMLVELRKEAAHHGCDAIFVKSVGSDAQSSPLASGTWAVKAITATCIRYTAADTAVSQAPAPKKD